MKYEAEWGLPRRDFLSLCAGLGGSFLVANRGFANRPARHVQHCNPQICIGTVSGVAPLLGADPWTHAPGFFVDPLNQALDPNRCVGCLREPIRDTIPIVDRDRSAKAGPLRLRIHGMYQMPGARPADTPSLNLFVHTASSPRYPIRVWSFTAGHDGRPASIAAPVEQQLPAATHGGLTISLQVRDRQADRQLVEPMAAARTLGGDAQSSTRTVFDGRGSKLPLGRGLYVIGWTGATAENRFSWSGCAFELARLEGTSACGNDVTLSRLVWPNRNPSQAFSYLVLTLEPLNTTAPDRLKRR